MREWLNGRRKESRGCAARIEIADTGFETAEIDAIVLDDGSDEEDELPSIEEGMPPVSQLGDQWILGEHRVLCADACDPKSFQRLLGRERAQMVFSDPPYNVPIDGHVSGLGVCSPTALRSQSTRTSLQPGFWERQWQKGMTVKKP